MAKPVVASKHAAIGNVAVNVKANQSIGHPNGRARAISHTGARAIAQKVFVTAQVAMFGFNCHLVHL
jgi:hypothetical protein